MFSGIPHRLKTAVDLRSQGSPVTFEKVGQGMHVAPVLDGLPSFYPWIQDKRISDYSSQFVPLIDQFASNYHSTTIHRQKFNKISVFLDRVKSTFAFAPDLVVLLPQFVPFIRFDLSLRAIVDLASKCTGDSDFSTEDDVHAIFQQFFGFWMTVIQVLQFVDPTAFVDVTGLYSAHISDVNHMVSVNPSHARGFRRVLASRDGFLDISPLTITGLISETPFSFVYETENNCTLEVFFPEQSDHILFRRYVASLRNLVSHPHLLGFVSATGFLPFAVAHEEFHGKTLQQKLDANELTSTDRSIILLELASALEFLHSLNITHRNVRPEAVFLTSENHVKLSGLHVSGPSIGQGRTAPFSPYTAPELLLNPDEYNQNIDVYSFTILAWCLITGECPLKDVLEPIAIENILKSDFRPKLTKKTPFPGFFMRGWSRDPVTRPSFSEIASRIEMKKILVPDTDIERFAQYLSVSIPRRAAMSGIVSELGRLILKRTEDLSDHDIGILVRLWAGEKDEEIQNALLKELRRSSPLSVNALVHLVKASMSMASIPRELCQLVSKQEAFVEFTKDLFESVPPDYALSFLAACGIPDDMTASVLLEFGARQDADITTRVVAMVDAAVPQSHLFFDYAHLHSQYFQKALSIIETFSDERLRDEANLIVKLAESSTEESSHQIKSLVSRIDPTQQHNFDKTCVVFKKLVEWRLSEIVLTFACHPPFCERFLVTLVPLVARQHPCFCLKLVLLALRFKGSTPLLLQNDLLTIILMCVQEHEYELAAEVALKVNFPREMLTQNHAIADALSEELDGIRNLGDASCVLLTMVPFAMAGNWLPNLRVVQMASHLLQSDDTTQVARALILAVGIAQNRTISKSLADAQNLEIVCRFFNSSAPLHFLYTAVRFLQSLAPFLRLSTSTTDVVRDAVTGAADLALKNAENPRLVLMVMQALACLPRGAQWSLLLNECGLSKLVSFTRSKFAGTPDIMEITRLLQSRCRNKEE
jgi:serine/threonine protein kinase